MALPNALSPGKGGLCFQLSARRPRPRSENASTSTIASSSHWHGLVGLACGCQLLARTWPSIEARVPHAFHDLIGRAGAHVTPIAGELDGRRKKRRGGLDWGGKRCHSGHNSILGVPAAL